MPQLNTVFDVIQRQNNGQPISLNFPTTGHQQFLLGSAAVVGTIPNPIALVDNGESFLNLSATAIPFTVTAAGTFQLGGQVEFQIDLNLGTGLTPVLASTGLQTAGAGPFNDNWLIEIKGLWDATSLKVRGTYSGWAANNTFSGVLNGGSAGNTAAALANLQFTPAVTCLNANSINTFTLTEFSGNLSD